VLIRRWPGLGRRLALALGLDNDLPAALLVRLLALHDLGKFAPNFQAKSPEHWNPALGNIEGITTKYDHASGGYALLGADPGCRVALPEWRELSPLAAAVTGHHGAPPQWRQDVRVFGRIGRAAAKLFADLIGELLPVPTITIESRRAARGSFAVAGFAVLCDWIGSNEDWFHYQEAARFDSLADYWGYAREQAERAVAETGVLPARSAPRREFREVFQELASRAFEPSPMQRWAAETLLPDGPFLAVLEDETGSGKTEAALMLAHRLLAAGRAEGLYVALPTMATANAMFGRLAKIYKRLFAADANPAFPAHTGMNRGRPRRRRPRRGVPRAHGDEPG
jgi:CRISPR-associated endonuclease/helicase Cas3